jgi:DAACS family dicarboxylate/amino acid:cation (Na+ or H+) symporter
MADDEQDISVPVPADEPESRPGGIPLYIWVIGAVVLAIPTGMLLGADASWAQRLPKFVLTVLSFFVTALDLIPTLIVRALGALAAPLVVLAILSAIVTNEIHGRQGARMMVYYLINTLVAMAIGLGLTNVIKPGEGTNLAGVTSADAPKRLIEVLVTAKKVSKALPPPKTVTDIVTEFIPKSIGDAFAQNNLAQLVLLTLALGIGLSKIRDEQRARGETSYLAVVDLLTVGFELLMRVLLWVVALVPIAVYGVVATSIAREGFELFLNLGWFILVVLGGLSLQLCWYLLQLAIFARMSPVRFLRGAADVLATTFSTASTTATMPVTLRALTGKLGVSRTSSQLAACIGTNFNNDGTALYQAVAALFFAQALGANLEWGAQLVIVLTTLVASVGAGGIPSGFFVTIPLIFAAVNLPPDKLPILLTIDWFLDRCRTSSNVLGDMTVAVLLDLTAEKRSVTEEAKQADPTPAAE